VGPWVGRFGPADIFFQQCLIFILFFGCFRVVRCFGRGFDFVIHGGILEIAPGHGIFAAVALVIRKETLPVPQLPKFAHDFG
jgi:uncharacterized membrane protein YjjP (DUF1212 family)